MRNTIRTCKCDSTCSQLLFHHLQAYTFGYTHVMMRGCGRAGHLHMYSLQIHCCIHDASGVCNNAVSCFAAQVVQAMGSLGSED